MKNISNAGILITRSLLLGSLSLSEQSQNEEQKLKGPVISIGKRNKLIIGKSELVNAEKLSAFYFEKMNMDSSDLSISSYLVSILRPDKRDADLDISSHTDAFPDRVREIFKTSPAKSKISFDNIKATVISKAGKSIRLMPSLTMTLVDD